MPPFVRITLVTRLVKQASRVRNVKRERRIMRINYETYRIERYFDKHVVNHNAANLPIVVRRDSLNVKLKLRPRALTFDSLIKYRTSERDGKFDRLREKCDRERDGTKKKEAR